MPYPEIAEWQVYFSQEPMLDHFWIGAQICSVLANVMGSGKKSYTLENFLPALRGRGGLKQSVQESLESVRAVMGESNGDHR